MYLRGILHDANGGNAPETLTGTQTFNYERYPTLYEELARYLSVFHHE